MRRSALLLVACSLSLALSGCRLFEGGPDPGLGRGRAGDACTETRYCRSGLICAMGACGPSGLGAEGGDCALSGDCGRGLYCNASRTCARAGLSSEGEGCANVADCEAGLLCQVEGFSGVCRPAGSADIGEPCTALADCLAGLSCVPTGSTRTCVSAPAQPPGTITPPEIPFWAGAECEVDEGPPTAYFRVPRGDASDGDFFRLPFPNDARRVPGGLDLSGFPTPGSALAIDVLGRTIAHAEADLDGFSTNPVVYFRFSRGYDGANIGDHVRWLDVTPGSPEYGLDRGLAWITTSGRLTRYVCPDWLAFRQGHGAPLRPGTTYAVILTRGILTAGSAQEFERAPDLDALLSSSMPAEAALQGPWRRYQPLRDWLAEQGPAYPASEILTVALFTTQSIEGDAEAIRAAVRLRPAPVLSDVTVCGDGVSSPCDDGTPQRRCGPTNPAYTEIHARITLPIVQEGTIPFETPEDGGALARIADGTATILRDEPVCMMMTIPSGTPPPGGFPVLIAAHGTGGSFTGPIGDGMAETAATGTVGGTAVRAATISWDAPHHGERRGDSMQTPDRLVFNFANPPAARDVWMQGAADLLALVYFAETYSAEASSSPTGEAIAFDDARITIFAHSQGATHAALMIGYEPNVRAIVLSGAGGDLTESLLTKTEPVNIAGLVPFALLDPDGAGNLVVGGYHPALTLLQTFYDGVDPVNFGRRFWREPRSATDTGRHVFMTYGLDDQFSPERTMAALARAAQLPQLGTELVAIGLPAGSAPAMGNVMVSGTPRTVGLVQYRAPAGTDGHFVSTTTGREDVTQFLLESLAGGTPTIAP